MGDELKSLSIADLRDLAKQKGIKNTSKMTKEALIVTILEEHNLAKKAQEDKETTSKEQKEETPKAQAEAFQPGDYGVEGVLEVLPDGFGFLRGENYLSTPKDIYVSPIQIKRFRLATGDKVKGIARTPKETEIFLS